MTIDERLRLIEAAFLEGFERAGSARKALNVDGPDAQLLRPKVRAVVETAAMHECARILADQLEQLSDGPDRVFVDDFSGTAGTIVEGEQ